MNRIHMLASESVLLVARYFHIPRKVPSPSTLRVIRPWLQVFLLVGILAACDKYSYFDFEEELPMHDGRTLLVNHHIQLGARGRKVGESSSPMWESFTFENPDRPGEIVTFKSPHTDYGPKTTLMLDVNQGVPYAVVGTAHGYKRPQGNPNIKAGCPAGVQECFQCPDPPYMLFRWRAGRWEQLTSFREFPQHFHRVNVINLGRYHDYIGTAEGGYPKVWIRGIRVEREFVEGQLKVSDWTDLPPFKEILRPYGDEINLRCPGNKNPPLTSEEIASGIRYP